MDDTFEGLSTSILKVIEKRKRGETLTGNERIQLHRFIEKNPDQKESLKKPARHPKVKAAVIPLPYSDQATRGYFAGLLDGEGSVFIIRIKGRSRAPYEYHPCVSISNTVREPLELLVHYYSGSVHLLRKENRGPQGRIGKAIFVWAVSCKKAKYFLDDVLPYLIIKRERARGTVEFQSRIIDTGKALTKDEIETRDKLWKEIMNRR
jgi:hypothetical protein